MPKFVLLWTDAAVWLLVIAMLVYIVHVRRTPNLAGNWRKVFGDAPALAYVLDAAQALLLDPGTPAG